MSGSSISYLSKMFLFLTIILFCVVNLLDTEAMKLGHSGKGWTSLGKLKSKSFLFYKSNIYNEQACKCTNSFSCSCCQTVTLVNAKTQKMLCAKFVYQRIGLMVEIALDNMAVKIMTITNYRPHRFCSIIPGALFSSVCVNIVELNAFAKSLTVCPILEITTKTQEWKLSYTCVSISTDLSAMSMSQTAAAGAISSAIIVAPVQGAIPMQAQLIILPAGTNLAGQKPPTMGPMVQMGTTKPPGTPSGMQGATVRPPGNQMGTMKPAGMSTTGQGSTMPKPASPGGTTKPPGNISAGLPPPQPGAQSGMTTPKNPSALSRQSLVHLDDDVETITFYSPESNDRSKYFPSRIPPAFMTNYTSFELQ